MSEEFKPIETQEDFNKALLKALREQRQAIAKEYGDYEALKEKAAGNAAAEQGYKDQIAALTGERDAARLEVRRIECARKYGIDPEDVARLRGSTAEEIEADAQSWADSIRRRRQIAPGASHDGGDISEAAASVTPAAREAIQQLRGHD